MAIVLTTIDAERLPEVTAVSALTLAELAGGPRGAEHEMVRAQRKRHLRYVEENVVPLDFDPDCARAYGPVYGAVAHTGRKPRGGRAVDLMIAATALAHELPLYTLNAKDLRGLENLIDVIDVGGRARS